jgi:ABC-type uncharacterized transport system fused permease/ATPase subunit
MPIRFVALSVSMFCLILWAILANLIAVLVGKEMPVQQWPMLALIFVALACVVVAWIDNRDKPGDYNGK